MSAGHTTIVVPDWLKDAFDILVTVLTVALVIGLVAVIVQNRRLANDLEKQQEAASQAQVNTCYDRHDAADALRPFITAFEREHRNDPRSQQAARNYLSIVVDTAPRISDCRALAAQLGVSPR